MDKYDIVFCTLTYIGADDLKTFINQAKVNLKCSYRIVVVDSYHDDKSTAVIKEIAQKEGCDFIGVQNRGYGAGNNAGIAYAIQHYNFDFLVVCNPDTEIKSLAGIEKYVDQTTIVAPKIIRNDGRNQNPMRIKENRWNDWLGYFGFKNHLKYVVYAHILINKLDRKLFETGECQQVHACHGSFIIFTKKVLSKLVPVFDENIFLFCEESDLAKKCKKLRLPIIYDPSLVVRHYEDGSMGKANVRVMEETGKSNVYYYEKWYKK